MIGRLRFKGKLGKRRDNDGFTLVEVLTSIAILSIVSVSLLRSFSVSAETNRIAREMDAAKSVCIETAEMFKDDPFYSPAEPTVGYLSAYNNSDIPGKFILYYNKDFNRSKTSKDRINSGDPEETVKGLSAYRVIITPTTNWNLSMSDFYYPEPAFNITLVNGANPVTLEWQSDSECVMDGFTNAANTIVYSNASMTAMVPLFVDCKNLTIDSEVQVSNLIGKLKETASSPEMTAIVDVYLYNIPKPVPPALPISVNVVAVDGISASNEISLGTQQMKDYTALIQVERLADSKIVAHYNVDKYWVEEVSP